MSSDTLVKAKKLYDQAAEQDYQAFIERWSEHVDGIGIREKGGPGSGHYGHSGRPGKHGGSSPGVNANPSSAADLETIADVSLPPDDAKYEYFYHAVRFNSQIDDVLNSNGIETGHGISVNRVYLSKDEIRDRGAGFFIVRVPKGVAAEATDVVSATEKYREWSVSSVPKGDIIRAVREVPISGTNGHTVREDQLARYILDGGADGVDALPTSYQDWFDLVHKEGVREKQLGIDDESKKNLLKVRTSIFFDDSDALTRRMYTGEISLGEYHETLKRLIRELNTSTAVIGKGGWDNMTSRDWGRTGPAIREQYRYLQGFVEYIDENRDTVSLRQLQARARLYGYGGERTAVMVGTPIAIADLLPWLPKDGSTECLNGCKCKWTLVITSTSGGLKHVKAKWVMDKSAENCDDCDGRNGHVENLSVPEHIEVPAQIGGY